MTAQPCIVALEGPMKLAQCVSGRLTAEIEEPCGCRLEESCPIQAPLQRVHERLREFLENVTPIADFIFADGAVRVLAGAANEMDGGCKASLACGGDACFHFRVDGP